MDLLRIQGLIEACRSPKSQPCKITSGVQIISTAASKVRGPIGVSATSWATTWSARAVSTAWASARHAASGLDSTAGIGFVAAGHR